MPEQNTDIEFDNDSAWPRRLLHIPTWTSFAWEPGNIYNGIKEPAYLAITYTWGRWQLADHEMPHIRALDFGTPWKVPRVRPECFTTDRLLALIRSLPTFEETDHLGAQFIWIDIACIDQREESREKYLEIGRQAAIFKGATKIFAWLHKYTNVDLEHTFRSYGEGFDLLNEEFKDETEASKLTEDQTRGLELVLNSLETMTTDPWFSSLWTLQEAYLRPDAILLDRNGEYYAKIDGTATATLYQFLTPCQLLFDILYTPLFRESKVTERLQSRLEKMGVIGIIYELPTLLLTAARFRTVSPERSTDRVYGIMQVFDLKLGKSAPGSPPGRDYDLRTLEDQLGSALLASNPELSQTFVNQTPAPAGQAWRMSSVARFPYSFVTIIHIIKRKNKDVVTIATLGTRLLNNMLVGHFAGPMVSLQSLAALWSRQHILSITPVQFELDSIPSLNPPDDLLPGGDSMRNTSPRRQVDLVNWVVKFDSNVKLLLLGHACATFVRSKGYSTVPSKYQMSLGLVLRRAEPGYPTDWQRLGICLWYLPGTVYADPLTPNADERALLDGSSKEWARGSGTFG